MLLTVFNYVTAVLVFFFAMIGNASGIMLMGIFYYGFSILSITGIVASFLSTTEFNRFAGWCSMSIANVLSVTVNFSLALVFFQSRLRSSFRSHFRYDHPHFPLYDR